jgi:hypothetical protein
MSCMGYLSLSLFAGEPMPDMSLKTASTSRAPAHLTFAPALAIAIAALATGALTATPALATGASRAEAAPSSPTRALAPIACLAIAIAALATGAPTSSPTTHPQLALLSTFRTGLYEQGGAEITAYDPATKRLFFVNAGIAAITVLDLRDPANPVRIAEIPTTYNVNSVAVGKGLVGAAIEGPSKTDLGTAGFFPTNFKAGSPITLTSVTVGSLPDMITFTPDGKTALVANEGEPNDEYTVDPEGSISIIDLKHGLRHLSSRSVKTIGFTDFNAGGPRADELPDDVRIYGPAASVAQDIEPEYIALDEKGRNAYVTLQENNAVAVIDIQRARISRILALGFKDHSKCGQGLDASDRDGGVKIDMWPLNGMYLPDAIATFSNHGRTYFATANEGDTRDWDGFSEEKRIKDITLDSVAFPDRATLRTDAQLGRLKITSTLGDADGDGKYEALYTFGTRSFTIWDAYGRLVFDSGDDFERITAELLPTGFNSDNAENNTFDSRSDDKGPEPEAITIGEVPTRTGMRTYAFIGLERIGGIMVYDITRPRDARFVQYLNARDFAGDAEQDTAGELGPESLVFVPAKQSPNGKALVIAGYEVSGSVAIYTFE